MDNEVLINEFEAAQAMPVAYVNLEESENNLLIDWESREIKFPEAMTNLGVRYDHRAKKIVLEMDRYVGGEDLATHTFAVHYYNYDGKTPEDEANGGLHPITNLDVSRPDKILCEWSITNKSTQIPGYLVFALHIFSIVDKAYTYHISTVAAAKPLNNTVVATSHGSNVTPDEIEVYIQMMTQLGEDIDKSIADFTSDMDGKMAAMDTLVQRAEAAADKFVIEDTLSYESENAVQNKVIAPRLFDLDRFKASAIIQKAKGRSIVINDSAKAAFPGMTTFGKSEQRKTTGAQLFDASKLATTSAGGATVTNNGDGSFTISGSGTLTSDFYAGYAYSNEETLKILKAGTLILNTGAMTHPKFLVKLRSGDGTVLWEIDNFDSNNSSVQVGVTGDMLLTDGVYISIGFYGQSGKPITPATIKPMLYFDGDSDGTWEPYTGNMPAPNPQYPQPIVNAGQKLAEGVVTDVGIGTEVLGGNLVDLTSPNYNNNYTIKENGYYYSLTGKSAWSQTSFDIKEVRGGETIYLSVESISGGNYPCVIAQSVTNNSSKQIERISVNSIGKRVVTLPKDADYLRIVVVVNDSSTALESDVTAVFKGIMLSKAQEASWQPYKPKQPLPINTPNGLPGIEVTDASLANYIDADGKMWVCDTREWDRGVDVQRILRKEYNGTEGWQLAERNETDGINGVFYIGQDNLVKDNGAAVCSHYIWGQNAAVNPEIFDTYHRQIRFNAISMTHTVDDWKAQLAEWAANGTPLRTLTQLVTPIETPIPEEEMAAWRAMHSNEPTTTILSDTDVEVDYVTDTKAYIDNQIAAIAAAAVSAVLAGSEV